MAELNTLISKLDKRSEAKCGKKSGTGRFEKKNREESTPSTLPPPTGAPDWTQKTMDVSGGTPHGGTGVGAKARRNIQQDLYTVEDIVNSQAYDSNGPGLSPNSER